MCHICQRKQGVCIKVCMLLFLALYFPVKINFEVLRLAIDMQYFVNSAIMVIVRAAFIPLVLKVPAFT